MKYGLVLPNGRNAYNISASDIKQFKTDPRKWGILRQIAISKQNKEQFKKTLDKWKQSGQTHRSGEKLTIKLKDK